MKNKLRIEYCTAWGYLGRAVALVRAILNEHHEDFDEASLIPSSGGVLEVSINEDLIFSKKELDRYPEKGEVEKLVNEKLGKDEKEDEDDQE